MDERDRRPPARRLAHRDGAVRRVDPAAFHPSPPFCLREPNPLFGARGRLESPTIKDKQRAQPRGTRAAAPLQDGRAIRDFRRQSSRNPLSFPTRCWRHSTGTTPRRPAISQSTASLSITRRECFSMRLPSTSMRAARQNGERRRKAVGRIEGRVFTVVYVRRSETIRIISARRANTAERRAYGEV